MPFLWLPVIQVKFKKMELQKWESDTQNDIKRKENLKNIKTIIDSCFVIQAESSWD